MKLTVIFMLFLGRFVEFTLTLEEVKCAPPGSVLKGQIIPNWDQYFYRDYIFVRCEKGYKLMMNGQEIESFHSLCQSNGQWASPLPECHIIDCGEPEPLLNGGVSFVSGERNEYLSVVLYHCNEPYYSLTGAVNANFRCEADRKWKAINDSELQPICIPVCGKPQVPFQDFQRIIGGEAAPHGSIPWQVQLHAPDATKGGGMLISDRWVLTAASVLCPNKCPVNTPPVPHNTLKIFWGSNTEENSLNTTAASLHLHPGYNNYDKLHFNNDIALIKLPEPITFDQYAMPICLPSEVHNLRDGDAGVVSGFGISKTEEKGYFMSDNLTYVRLPVVNQRKCSDSLRQYKRKHRFTLIPVETSNMFCAGHSAGSKDSCYGDGGGPIAFWKTDHYWVAGIVSWGLGCAEKGTYGFYTRVQNYVDWIHQTMNEN